MHIRMFDDWSSKNKLQGHHLSINLQWLVERMNEMKQLNNKEKHYKYNAIKKCFLVFILIPQNARNKFEYECVIQ